MERKRKKQLDHNKKGGPSRRSSIRRRKKWTVGVLLGLLVVGGAGAVAWLRNGTPVKPEQAPRFALPSSDDRIISLEDYLGKQEVILFFYMIHT